MLKVVYKYISALLRSFIHSSTDLPCDSGLDSQDSSAIIRVIIGNGAAGLEAAKTLRKLDKACRVIMISEESKLHWSRPALMYLFMDELSFEDSCPYPEDWFKSKRIELVQATVLSVDRSKQTLTLSNDQELEYQQLLVACGSVPKTLADIPIELEQVSAFYHLKDCEKLKQQSLQARKALIIGGGLIAVELAEILLYQGLIVELIIQDPWFAAHILAKEEAVFLSEYLQQKGVLLHYSTQVQSFKELTQEQISTSLTRSNTKDDASDLSHKTQLKHIELTLNTGQKLQTELVLMAIGVEPAVKAIKGLDDLIQQGLVVNQSLQSRDPFIFAAGDCAERTLDTSHQKMFTAISGTWYEAKAMGKIAAHTMHEVSKEQQSVILQKEQQKAQQDPSQDPNPDSSQLEKSSHVYHPQTHQWFNSAKFFDLEYQEYGLCLNSLNYGQFPDIDSIFYLEPKLKQSIRIFYHNDTLLGICSLGLRLRQQICQVWLNERKTIPMVIANLGDLNFDPEFNLSILRTQQALQELQKQYKSKINP